MGAVEMYSLYPPFHYPLLGDAGEFDWWHVIVLGRGS